jgi:hypothetical protein
MAQTLLEAFKNGLKLHVHEFEHEAEVAMNMKYTLGRFAYHPMNDAAVVAAVRALGKSDVGKRISHKLGSPSWEEYALTELLDN